MASEAQHVDNASSKVEEGEENEHDEDVKIDQEKHDCILDHMEVNIAEAEKRTNTSLNIRQFYTVYLIETKVTDDNWIQVSPDHKTSMVWRRFTEFEHIRNYLQATYPYIIMPPLPEKKPMYIWRTDGSKSDITDPDFVDRRRACLENFLHRISSHSILSYDKLFLSFLRQESGWRETYKQHVSSNSNTLLLSRYLTSSSQNQSFKLKHPNKHMDKMKVYSEHLNISISNILKVMCRKAHKLYTIHKLHESYGKVLCEWSAIEKEMGDGLQKAGHFFDSIAEFIVPALEEEEVIADQLKEYMFFADSLMHMYKQYEAIQYQVEQNHEAVASKKNEKIKLQEGRTNFLFKIFGSIDTEEVKEMKISECDRRIEVLEENLEELKNDVNTFTTKAIQEYEYFEDEKCKSIKQSLQNYATLQVRVNKKALNTWINIRNCIDSIP